METQEANVRFKWQDAGGLVGDADRQRLNGELIDIERQFMNVADDRQEIQSCWRPTTQHK